MPYYPPDSAGGGGSGSVEKLSDIGDVEVTPASQVLKFHAPNYWGSVPDVPKGVGGSSRVLYFSNVISIGTGPKNSVPVYSLVSVPVTTGEQTVSFNVPAGGTVSTLAAFHYNTELDPGNNVSIPAGTWTINPYFATDVWTKGVDTARYVISQAYLVVTNAGGSGTSRVTTSGSGTTRTATATSGTPFATTMIVASSINTDASYLQTPLGFYQIIGRTSDTVVTIQTPSGYTNEVNISFHTWAKFCDLTKSGSDHTIVSTSPSLYSSCTTRPQSAGFLLKFGVMFFGYSSHARTITFTSNGDSQNSSIVFPALAGGDLSSVYPNPTVWRAGGLKTNGLTVVRTDGNPAPAVVGSVLTTTSSSSAGWQYPIVRYIQTTSLTPGVNTLCKQALAGANLTVALPASHVAGDIIKVKMTSAAGGNTITVDPNAAQTIDGQPTFVMSQDYQAVQCESDGANWLITG